MDITSASSPPLIRISDHNGSHGPGRSATRSSMNPFSKAQRPMAIPNARAEPPPPPLPPPRFIDDGAAGGAPDTPWPDTSSIGSAKSGGSVSPRSSLRGSWGYNMAQRGSAGRPDYRRGSSNSTIKSQPEADRRYDFSRHVDEGYHSLSGSSLVNQQYVYMLSPAQFPQRCGPGKDGQQSPSHLRGSWPSSSDAFYCSMPEMINTTD